MSPHAKLEQQADFLLCRWRGDGVKEEGVDTKTGKVVVKVDPAYFRPAEVEYVLPPYLLLFLALT